MVMATRLKTAFLILGLWCSHISGQEENKQAGSLPVYLGNIYCAGLVYAGLK